MLLTPLSLEKKCLQESPEWGQRWCGGDTGRQRVPRLSSCDWECSVAKWRPPCGRNHDVGTGGRAQSLARLYLGHELEVFREVSRADTMQTGLSSNLAPLKTEFEATAPPLARYSVSLTWSIWIFRGPKDLCCVSRKKKKTVTNQATVPGWKVVLRQRAFGPWDPALLHLVTLTAPVSAGVFIIPPPPRRGH